MLSQEKSGKQSVPHIQLCNFGLTKVDDNSFGLTTCFTTTNQFEAPELRKTKNFTTASDMYAFGGVLLQVRSYSSTQALPYAYKHKILYSKYPFSSLVARQAYNQAKTPAECPKPDDVSPAHWELMLKHWSRTPEDRPDAIRELKQFIALLQSTVSWNLCTVSYAYIMLLMVRPPIFFTKSATGVGTLGIQ